MTWSHFVYLYVYFWYLRWNSWPGLLGGGLSHWDKCPAHDHTLIITVSDAGSPHVWINMEKQEGMCIRLRMHMWPEGVIKCGVVGRAMLLLCRRKGPEERHSCQSHLHCWQLTGSGIFLPKLQACVCAGLFQNTVHRFLLYVEAQKSRKYVSFSDGVSTLLSHSACASLCSHQAWF